MAESSPPDGSPYPSFKELRSNQEGVCFSAAAKRLHWPLQGAFPSAISVMRTARNAAELDPFFQPDNNGSGSGGTWHDIASLPVTDPKVSSIVASIRDLDQWEVDWVATHREHAMAEYITYGDLSDEDRPYADGPKEDGSWEEDSDTEFLIRCCGEDRPLRKRGLKLEVTPSAGNDFVSVRDYVGAVHPWLMALRVDIIRAQTVAHPGLDAALVADNEWIVCTVMAPEHEIVLLEQWMEMNHPPRPRDAATSRFLQRIGARTAP